MNETAPIAEDQRSDPPSSTPEDRFVDVLLQMHLRSDTEVSDAGGGCRRRDGHASESIPSLEVELESGAGASRAEHGGDVLRWPAVAAVVIAAIALVTVVLTWSNEAGSSVAEPDEETAPAGSQVRRSSEGPQSRKPLREFTKITTAAELARTPASVTALGLSGPQISDKEVAALSRFTKLRRLYLHACIKITDASLAELPPSLQWLRIHHCKGITQNGMRHLLRLQRLTDLEIPGELDMTAVNESGTNGSPIGIDDAGLRFVGRLPQLRSLRIGLADWVGSLGGLAEITDAGLRHLAGLVNLEQLDLARCERITPAGIKSLRKLKKLRWLRVSTKHFRDQDLAVFADFPRLEELHLPREGRYAWPAVAASGQIRGGGLRHLEALQKLRLLGLRGQPIRAAGLRALTRLPNLQELDMAGSGITEKGLAILEDAKQLRHLNLATLQGRGPNITAAGIRSIVKIPRLETLNLARSRVDDVAVALLVVCPLLKSLNLQACDSVGDGGLVMLMGGLADQLESLHLSHCTKLTDKAFVAVGAAKKLRYLSISAGSPAVTGNGLMALHRLTMLQRLDLYDHGVLGGRIKRRPRTKINVSDADYDKLVRALPACKVVYHRVLANGRRLPK